MVFWILDGFWFEAISLELNPELPNAFESIRLHH